MKIDNPPFKSVDKKDLKRGHIVTLSNGHHTEILTTVPLKYPIADDGFCSIGAGRSNENEIGTIKCDSWHEETEEREIDNPANSYHCV